MELSRSHSLSLLPFFLISLAFLSYCFTTADLINDVCSSTRNPPLCNQALKSDPRAANADLKGLGQIAIDLATRSAKATKDIVNSLKQSAPNPRLKGIYDSCLENYSDGIDDLADAATELNSGDYLGVSLKASAVEDDADTCDNNFQDANIPEPQQLVDASNSVQGLSSTVLVVANRLRGA